MVSSIFRPIIFSIWQRSILSIDFEHSTTFKFSFLPFFLSNYPSKRISKNRKTLVIYKISRDLSLRSISSYIYDSKHFKKRRKTIFSYIYIQFLRFYLKFFQITIQFNFIDPISRSNLKEKGKKETYSET